MATDVLHTKTQLTAPLVIDLANNSLEYKFWAALRDPKNGPLTIEAQGSDEGARAFILESIGDWIEFPVHGIRVVTLTAATYPCWIGYGIVREAARVSEDATSQGIASLGSLTDYGMTVQGAPVGSGMAALPAAIVDEYNLTPLSGAIGSEASDSITGNAIALGQVAAVVMGQIDGGGASSNTSWRAYRIPNIFKVFAAVSVTSGTPVAVWTPSSGKKFRLMGGGVSLSVAGAIQFEDGSGHIIWQTPTLVAGQPYNLPDNFGNGILSSAANNVLYINVTASGVVNGGVFGTEE